MAQVINTNSLSLITQNNMNKSQSALGTAIERLSSGLRINSAKDDAAGQAIANRFTSNINGLTQAARNANDGISAAQTTEGALSEINNNLQRIRELTVQSQNGTNSDSDISSIQDEIKARLDEIDRVSGQTQFNGVNVLAKDGKMSIQVGANDGETIDIDLKAINSSVLGLNNLDVSSTITSDDIATTATTTLQAAAIKVTDLTYTDTAGAASWAVYTDDDNADTHYVSKDGGTTLYAATYNSTTNSLEFDSTTAATPATGATASAGKDISFGDGKIIAADDITGRTDDNAAAAPSLYLDKDGAYYASTDGGTTFVSATVDTTTGSVSYDSSAAAATPVGVGSALTEVNDPSAAVNVDLSSVTGVNNAQLFALKDGSGYVVKGTDDDGKDVMYKATVNTTTGAVTQGAQVTEDPLSAIDDAISTVDKFRSSLGAIQNRLDSAITNLNNTTTNLSEAQSRIQDADYATEVSNMSKAQIIQQAGNSVLAKANQVPQQILSLLQG
ncbi:flagellin [Pantoea sp. CTOTU50773]|uniref:flagellin N-terminal helical domain-containing protein n=1 Tax=Pantoea sp. CTOTU50773 TaxID=2953853 RepID=UPI0028A79C8C|nr:flagellin [Pantoea sp. CTOTU50773]